VGLVSSGVGLVSSGVGLGRDLVRLGRRRGNGAVGGVWVLFVQHTVDLTIYEAAHPAAQAFLSFGLPEVLFPGVHL
jgi:hypothetical protein